MCKIKNIRLNNLIVRHLTIYLAWNGDFKVAEILKKVI